MTSNMINYRNLQESRRHNREMERLTGEQQAEVARHNLAVETETQRTNMANEAIKAQQNVINGNHYGKSDFETARHNSIVEYYQYQLPTAKGQTDANVAKTWAEAGLDTAKTSEAKASTAEKKASAAEKQTKATYNESSTMLNYVKMNQVIEDINLKKAQTDKVRKESSLIETKEIYTPWTMGTEAFRNVMSSFKIVNVGTK